MPVEPALTDDERFRGDVLDATRLPEIERWAAGHAGTATYLAVSAQMAAHAEYFGDLPAGSLTALEAAVRASPRWTVFHEATGITIFQLRSSG